MGARYEFDTGICTGDYTRTQPFSMSIVMQPGVGTDGNGMITLSTSSVTKGDATDSSNLGGACKIPGIKQAIGALVESLVKDPLARIDSFEVTIFSGAVSGALSTLSSQIILPAPSVFMYKDLSFNNEFDLVADFSYSTQNH